MDEFDAVVIGGWSCMVVSWVKGGVNPCQKAGAGPPVAVSGNGTLCRT
jgi:hypothetical protein